MPPTEYELGLLVGLLIGEGHFGGDGRQAQITLRMHVRHEELFRWLERTFPGGRLYGPYDHGGRHYYQWMVRGAYLRDELLPLLGSRITPDLDGYAYDRVTQMAARYGLQLSPKAGGDLVADPDATDTDSPDDPDQEGLGDLPPAPALSRAESIFSRMRDPDST